MGKKGKLLKIKQYKVPEEKFLVVINPWAVFEDFNQEDFNRIGFWFDRMLRDKYPLNSRIRAIYYQRTHRNIIVELPKEVKDVEPFLGAHFCLESQAILNANQPDKVAYIYEYKYASFGDPATKNFKLDIPQFDDIPNNLCISDPYPLPSPAPPPPPDVQYARAIPPEVNKRIADRLHDQMGLKPPEPGPSMGPTPPHSPSSSQVGPIQVGLVPPNDFTPYVRPGFLDSTLTARSKQTAPINSSGNQPKRDPYDDDDKAQALLTSIIKTEETMDSHEYKPSAELLDALGSLPEDIIELKFQVKAEETEEKIIKLEPTDEITLSDYQPSADLLVALATLQQGDDMEFPVLKSTQSPPKRRIQEVVRETQPRPPSKRVKKEEPEQ